MKNETFEIKNKTEFDTYSEIEKKVEDLNSWMEFYIDPSLSKKLHKKLEKLEAKIFQLRQEYQKKQLKKLRSC